MRVGDVVFYGYSVEGYSEWLMSASQLAAVLKVQAQQITRFLRSKGDSETVETLQGESFKGDTRTILKLAF